MKLVMWTVPFSAALLISTAACHGAVAGTNYIRGEFRELNDNGAWSWFMDERVIVDNGRLIVGSVRANGTFRDNTRPGWGNVELAILDLKSQAQSVVVLHEKFEQDDHNNPGLLTLADGRYLAAFSKHNQEPRVYFRISTRPHDPFEWQPVKELATPGVKGNWTGDNFTYCNPFRLTGEKGRIYLFHRGVGQDPNCLVSDDDGRTWTYGGKLYIGRDGYSPYTKYASNGRDTMHFVATEDHPRNFDNSLYHGFVRGGKIFASDGRLIAPLSRSTNTSVRANDLTRIYQGGPSNVAWMTDLHLDSRQRPVVLFTTQRDGAGLRPRQGGMDHRFHYASWDGKRWSEHEIAYAGKRLYAGEDDYTGLGAIDPQNTRVVYISTDADPTTGQPLISTADGHRHYEIFRGETPDRGGSWQWTAVTANSSADNLRPIVPVWNDSRTALVWMRGAYRSNRGEWTTKVVVTILKRSDSDNVRNAFADEPAVTPPMVGHWEGDARIIVNWCQQTKLPLAVDIRADGSVTGQIGDATLTNGFIKRNRGWMGQKFNVKTDYIITGNLSGSIVAAESITRSGVKVPLNFTGGNLIGGVHTSGSKVGGKDRMILSAASLKLTRTRNP